MILDVPCRMAYDPFREELDAWEGIPLRRLLKMEKIWLIVV
jgi:hypothetical protein